MTARLIACLFALLAAGTSAAQDGPPANGVFLVARPGLTDPNFERTVVLVTQHRGRDTIGVIVNRPTPIPLRDLFPGNAALKDAEAPVFSGGPVSRNTLVFLFRSEATPPRSLHVLEDVWLSTDPELLSELLARAEPTLDLRVFAGYAGWAPGQLAHEMARGSWYLVRARPEDVFGRDTDGLWEELLGRATARQVRRDPLPSRPPPPASLAAAVAAR